MTGTANNSNNSSGSNTGTGTDNVDNVDIDPREFTIPATDNKGHSERVWARITPGHDRQISVVLNSHWFPYRSRGDIVRHALQKHLAWLETLAPVPSISAQVDAINEIMRDEEFNREFDEVISKLSEQVGHYLSMGNVGKARGLVSRVLSKVEMMPDSEWKDSYQKTISDRFGQLVDGKPIEMMSKED